MLVFQYLSRKKRWLYFIKWNAVGIWIANIWIANFYLFLIQKVCYSDSPYHGTGHLNNRLVFIKWWSEYRSVNQTGIWMPNYHGTRNLNSKPFDERTNLHDLNTKLVCYSDPYCIMAKQICFTISFITFVSQAEMLPYWNSFETLFRDFKGPTY